MQFSVLLLFRATGGSTGKKLLRLVDKLTQNKYFQQATENKFVKRAMEGVSNTPLMLSVELRSLIGTLAVNIPPPPTDRIWCVFNAYICKKFARDLIKSGVHVNKFQTMKIVSTFTIV